MSETGAARRRTGTGAAGRYLLAAAKIGGAALCGFVIFLLLARFGAFGAITTVAYRGAVLALVACGLLFALLLLVNRAWQAFSEEAVVAVLATTLSGCIAFVIVAPVTVDRSITVFLLSHMDHNPGQSFTPAELQAEFERTYLGEWDQVARRMEEQSVTGYVEEVAPGEYRITPQGRRAMAVFRLVADAFRTDPRFVGAERQNP